MKIGPVTDAIIASLGDEIKKPETREKIMTSVIDPLVADIMNRYYPFFIVTIIILVVIIALLLAILILSVSNKSQSSSS